MNNQIIVLPSARAIRHEQFLTNNKSLFLPNYITMSDFISKLCIVKGYRYIDEDSRILLLLEASNFNDFKNLQIERNFFTFTKNSSYIFKFFEELSAELFDINELSFADVYAEYEEHISILQELYKRYKKLLEDKKYIDKIFLPDMYEFNSSFLKQNHEVIIYVDGYLTNFELELLQKATVFSSIYIRFSTTPFNIKIQNKLNSLGFNLEVGYDYNLLLNSFEIIFKKKREKLNNITTHSFSESILQVAFVKQKIYEFISKGYKAENIAVILPNEAMSNVLKSFDEKANLNFAMGESYSNTKLYIKLNATLNLIEQDSKENEARVERVGDELYLKLYAMYYKNVSEVDFIAFMKEIKEEFQNKQELKIYEEELYKFEKLIPMMQDMGIKSVFKIFMQRLASRSVDDIRGGKVTVMGVLETRSVTFDAVIILDFDDNNVPKRSNKDMFLNTQIRENANLPTMNDRENLQKHYYEMLMSHSKEVAISYVKSTQSSASKFLKQLDICENNIYDERELSAILFNKTKKRVVLEKEIIEPYSFKNIELSATRLKNYLTCKRKYYYKYVKNISHHEIPKDMPQEYEIGNVIHKALKEVYSKKSSYLDVQELKRDINMALDEFCGFSELDKYLVAMQKKRLDDFVYKEIDRFNSGWHVYKCEEFFKESFCGITIIGQIDRVDKKDNLIEVLDYKTGSYTLNNKNNFMDTKDFQLEFYYLLASGLGNVQECAFYDLKESKIVPETFLSQKIEILKSHIKDLLSVKEINFEKCEDKKSCLFCEYKIMCGRE